MEKLKRLGKLQLKTILKGFFPSKYIKIKNDGKVIVKNYFFSFKKIIDSDVPEVLTSILPYYLSSCGTSESLGQHLKKISSLKTEKDIVNYLYSEYVSLSHKITPEFIKGFKKDIEATNFKRVSEPLTLESIFKFFKKPQSEHDKEVRRLSLMPSEKVEPLQKEILAKKKEIQLNQKHGKITVSSKGERVNIPEFDNRNVYDGNKEYVERILTHN